MSFTPSHLLYEGKCKKVFCIQDHDDKVWLEFKDTLTAFNAQKTSSFSGKGALNRDTSSLIFKYLKNKGTLTHWIANEGESCMVARKIDMIHLEVVVRNRLAGSTAKKFQIKDGTLLDQPLFELYYKVESLGDPFISGEQALMLKAVESLEDIQNIQKQALKINKDLLDLFNQAKMDLIDFKLEFGKTKSGQIVLGDEISADSCRIWNRADGKKLDKDRFRLDLGSVEEGYRQIYSSLYKIFS